MDPPSPDELPMEESEDVESLPLRDESLPGGDESDPEVVVPLPNDEELSDEESPPKGQAVASDEVQLLLAMVKGIRGRRARRTAGLERYIFVGKAIGLSAISNNWLHLSCVYVVAVVSNGVRGIRTISQASLGPFALIVPHRQRHLTIQASTAILSISKGPV